MIDGNTAALNDYQAQQDRNERIYQTYYPRAKQRALDEIRENRARDVFEILCDDLPSALGIIDERVLVKAWQRNDRTTQGITIDDAMDRAAESLLTDDDIRRHVWQLAEDERR